MRTWILDLSLLETTGFCVRVPTESELLNPEGRIFVRTASPADLKELMRSEELTWLDPKQRSTPDQMLTWLLEYSQAFYMAMQDGVIWGMINLLRRNFPWDNPEAYPNYEEESDVASLDLWGDTLGGVNLGVRPDAPDMIGLALTHAGVATLVLEGIESSFVGARISGYKNFRDRMTPQEYVALRDENGQAVETLIRMMENVGCKLVGLKKGYFYDPDSDHYCAVMRYMNPRSVWKIENGVLFFEIPDIENEALPAQFGMRPEDLLNNFCRTVFRLADKIEKIKLEIKYPAFPKEWLWKFEKIIELIRCGDAK
jgi:hypothetical protein